MKISSGFAVAFAASLVVAACGGGGDAPVLVAAADTTVAISPANGAEVIQAVASQPLSFPTGVPALGTTAPTTVTISSATPSAPTFSVDSTEGQATGDLTFGSCKFTVKTSTFRAGHPMSAGQTITVSPCSITADTSGNTANGVPVQTPVQLVLGPTLSTSILSLFTIAPSGAVTIQTPSGSVINVGTITVTPVSG